MAKSRILIISPAKNLGGGEIYLRNVVDELSKKYQVTVLGPRFVSKFLGSKVDTVWLPLFPSSLDKILRRTHQLKRLYYRLLFRLAYRTSRYDVTNIQWFDGALIEAIQTRPLMLTLHVDFVISRRHDAYVAHVLNGLDRIICVSGEAKRQLVKRGVSAEKCIVVYNGVDPSAFVFNSRPGEYVTWIGRVERAQKNPELFLEIALSAYTQRLPLKFRMVGGGSYLSQVIKDCPPNLELAGAVKPEDMAKIYREASVLCMTSFYEGLPYVALEAMACGVPVVSTAVSGPNELLAGDAGVLVDSFNAKKLLSEINRLIGDPKRYNKIRKTARLQIENKFSKNNSMKQTIPVYSELVDKKSRL